MVKMHNILYSGYYLSSDIRIGSAVDNNRSFGDVMFDSKSDIVFESKDNISIFDGVKLRSGSKIKLIAQKEIHISSLDIESGAYLEMNAPKIIINNGIQIPKGAILKTNGQID